MGDFIVLSGSDIAPRQQHTNRNDSRYNSYQTLMKTSLHGDIVLSGYLFDVIFCP